MLPRRRVRRRGHSASPVDAARVTGDRIPSRSWIAVLLVAICTTLGGVLLGVGLGRGTHQPASSTDNPTGGSVTKTDTPAPTTRATTERPQPVLSPIHLEIPAIDVATTLVRLGLMPDRTVEVPSNPDQAGWFHRGPAPGQRGSAVILGHVDSSQGPAVFARLRELEPGDRVRVDRADGSAATFVVRKAVLYANEDFPARGVYAARDGRRLNLVTCGGSYDATRGGYQSNLVVYTHRAPSPRADLGDTG